MRKITRGSLSKLLSKITLTPLVKAKRIEKSTLTPQVKVKAKVKDFNPTS